MGKLAAFTHNLEFSDSMGNVFRLMRKMCCSCSWNSHVAMQQRRGRAFSVVGHKQRPLDQVCAVSYPLSFDFFSFSRWAFMEPNTCFSNSTTSSTTHSDVEINMMTKKLRLTRFHCKSTTMNMMKKMTMGMKMEKATMNSTHNFLPSRYRVLLLSRYRVLSSRYRV